MQMDNSIKAALKEYVVHYEVHSKVENRFKRPLSSTAVQTSWKIFNLFASDKVPSDSFQMYRKFVLQTVAETRPDKCHVDCHNSENELFQRLTLFETVEAGFASLRDSLLPTDDEATKREKISSHLTSLATQVSKHFTLSRLSGKSRVFSEQYYDIALQLAQRAYGYSADWQKSQVNFLIRQMQALEPPTKRKLRNPVRSLDSDEVMQLPNEEAPALAMFVLELPRIDVGALCKATIKTIKNS